VLLFWFSGFCSQSRAVSIGDAMADYVWATPPADYEVKPGDEVQFTINAGWLAPPLWLVEDAMTLSDKYELTSARYEGSDLIIECRIKPLPEIEIIQAGALPAWIIAALVGGGLYLLYVKNFKIKVSPEQGIEFETSTSTSAVLLLAALGAGLYWFSRKK
jgi:hypothetical protein